jgi:FMN-dependent NADH-azoreductase
MTILHIDSSILGPYSVSRGLSAKIVARLLEVHPGTEVIYRDLATEQAQHLSSAHMAVFQGAPVTDPALGADLALGNAYIDDLFAADTIVIGAPMYNFTIPTQLKGWVDRVCVAGRTFRYSETGPVSLLPPGKKAYIASARGGIYSEGPMAAMEHHESYLRGALGFLGITDVTVIRAEGVGLSPEAKTAAVAAASEKIAVLAA